MKRKKGIAALLLLLPLITFLTYSGQAAAPGTAGITFVEDESSSVEAERSTSSSKPSSSSSREQSAKGEGEEREASRDVETATDEPAGDANLVSIFNPELPLAALGSLPKTGSDSTPFLLSIGGALLISAALWLLLYPVSCTQGGKAVPGRRRNGNC